MTDKQSVLDKIANAFQNERFPDEVDLFIWSGNHIFDTKEATALLQHEHWNQIPQKSLIRNRDRISYLTEVGFRFTLPAFLIAAIKYPHEVDVLRDNIIFALIPPDSSHHYKYELFVKRAKMLSEIQIDAIASFFEAYLDIYPVSDWSFNTEDKFQNERAIQFWRSRK